MADAATFTTCGKQVLLNGEHYADARSPLAAEMIAHAMNLWARAEGMEPKLED